MDLSGDHLDVFRESLCDAQCVGDVWMASTTALAKLGFDHITYLMVRLAAPHDRPHVLSSMPDWWQQIYFSPDHVKDDPLFRFCSHLQPQRTGSDYLDLYPDLSDAERDRVVAAGDIGCRSGFASPIGMIGSSRCGGWNFGSSLDRMAFEQIYPLVRDQAQLIGLYAHTQIETLSQRHHEIETEPESILSSREQECLSFLAKGVRTSSIARLLEISPATVEFHVKNTKRKLGAATREEALARAITRKQIAITH